MNDLSTEVAMTALEKIEGFLCQNPGRAYCDDCLSAVLRTKPRQQVHQKTSQLAQDNRFWRQSGICFRCEETKVVIRLRIALIS
jgi:hypothetical protein